MSETTWVCKNCAEVNPPEAEKCTKCEAKQTPTQTFADKVNEIVDKHLGKE